MEHLIFDLDGTIIDSREEIKANYEVVFRQIPPKQPVDTAGLDYSINITELLKSVYGNDEAKVGLAKRLFSEKYDNSNFSATPLYEGIVDALRFLHGRGHRLYIATNKRMIPTTRILELKGIRQLFADIFANEMIPGRSLPKPVMLAELKNRYQMSTGFMIGDSIGDLVAARKAGLTAVAVGWGYENREVLMTGTPDYFITSIENLCTFVNL